MASSTLARLGPLTVGTLFSARETVVMEPPAAAATSWMLALLFSISLSHYIAGLDLRLFVLDIRGADIKADLDYLYPRNLLGIPINLKRISDLDPLFLAHIQDHKAIFRVYLSYLSLFFLL